MNKKLIEYETATFLRRFGAYFIDFILILMIWYIITVKDLIVVDEILNNIDPDKDGSLEIFVQAIFKLYVAFIFKWFFVQALIRTLFPAIIGDGKTIGKLLTQIAVVDCNTFKEIPPIKLIFREVICRGLIETILVIPSIISLIIYLFRKDSRCLHDLLSNTIVIRRSIGEEE